MRALVVLFIALFVSSFASAQTSDARARWDKLPEARKAELRERYDRLAKMPESERARLRERVEAMRREAASILASLTPDERAAYDALDEDARRAMLRSMLRDRARLLATRARARMTYEEQAKLDRAKPEGQREILRGVQERDRRRLSHSSSQLARELGISRKELGRLRDGTKQERRAAVAALIRARVVDHVANHGLPKGFDEPRWRHVVELDDAPFLRAISRIRARQPEFGVPPKRWSRSSRQRRGLVTRLEALATPTPADRAARPRASEMKLRRDALLRSRDEVERTMARAEGATEAQAAELRALSDDDFVKRYRGLMRKLRRPGTPRNR